MPRPMRPVAVVEGEPRLHDPGDQEQDADEGGQGQRGREGIRDGRNAENDQHEAGHQKQGRNAHRIILSIYVK